MVALADRLSDHLAAALRLAPSQDPDFLSGFLCGPVFDALGIKAVARVREFGLQTGVEWVDGDHRIPDGSLLYCLSHSGGPTSAGGEG